eukprot:1040502-Alexandrium_andersonii.AAC.1
MQKRVVVFAWLRDPQFKETFFTLVEKVAATTSVRREVTWLTKKQAEDTWGDEFQSMLQDGVIISRRMKDNPKYKEYLKTTDKGITQIDKTQSMQNSGQKKISGQELSGSQSFQDLCQTSFSDVILHIVPLSTAMPLFASIFVYVHVCKFTTVQPAGSSAAQGQHEGHEHH